jgi:DNA-binding MarR family transcriptional regulator
MTANTGFLDIVTSGEELHRQFLDLIQTELEGLDCRDINKVRALMLLNIGDNELTISDLLWRGCYLGTNVSYNLKRLTETGYVVQTRCASDRRVVRVRNSQKGLALCQALQDMNNRHIAALTAGGLTQEDADACRKTLKMLQRFCNRAMDARPAIRPEPAVVHDLAA